MILNIGHIESEWMCRNQQQNNTRESCSMPTTNVIFESIYSNSIEQMRCSQHGCFDVLHFHDMSFIKYEYFRCTFLPLANMWLEHKSKSIMERRSIELLTLPYINWRRSSNTCSQLSLISWLNRAIATQSQPLFFYLHLRRIRSHEQQAI